MFAIVKTGGKQYKVSPGDLLTVERLEGDAGQSILLTTVLLINNQGKVTTGTPFLSETQVNASIVKQERGDKIDVFKKKRRQGYRRWNTHRQDLTVLRIEGISAFGIQMDSTTVSTSITTKKKDKITEIMMHHPKETSASSQNESRDNQGGENQMKDDSPKPAKKAKVVSRPQSHESSSFPETPAAQTAILDKKTVKKATTKKSHSSTSIPSADVATDASKSE